MHGYIVYCSCSTESEEGEEVIESFLRKNSDFYLDDLSSYLPVPLKGRGLLTEFRVYPHRHGTDGFFAARMGKEHEH